MPPTPTKSKPKSSKRRSKAAAAAAKPEVSHAEKMRLGSILLTGDLNAKMAKNDRRRAAANEEPLMQFVLPEDFFSRPRMFGYKIDDDKWLEYAKSYRLARGESQEEVDNINHTTLLTSTLFLLRRRSGIKYLDIEWCLPEDQCSETSAERSTPRPCTPSSDGTAVGSSSPRLSSQSSVVPTRPSEDSSSDDGGVFPILMLFMVARYKKLCKRPTQKQVDILNKELGREPEWFVDAEEFDP